MSSKLLLPFFLSIIATIIGGVIVHEYKRSREN